jgi:PAS domain S-box-containing protein
LQNSEDRSVADEIDDTDMLDESRRIASDLRLSDKKKCKVCSLEITGDCAWSLDLRTGEISVCDRFDKVHGVSSSKIPGHINELLEYIHEDDREPIRHFMTWPRHDSKKISASFEYRFRQGDGSWRWMLARARVVDWYNGAPSRVISINSDITSRKKNEKKIQDITERFRESQRLARMGDWSFDLATGQILWSDMVFELFERDKALGPPTFDENMKYFTFQSVKRLQAAIERVQKTGNEVSLDLEVRLPGNRTTYQNSILTAVEDKDGNVVGLKGIVQDVTRRKRAERERERMIADLEDANKELERFTYTVSHDLRSPLITILGFVDQLEQEARNDQYDLLHDDIDRITNSAIRMQRLLDELLELSRVGRIDEEQEKLSLTQIVSEAVEICSGRLNNGNIEVNIDENMPDIMGNRSRILRVMQNLIDNAAKYMGDQPQPHIEVFKEVRAGQPVLCVRDNGIGIATADQEAVFGLFDQLAPDAEGTGLGLALVQRIVNAHGGRIWVESEGLGCGSSFYLILPFVPDEETLL